MIDSLKAWFDRVLPPQAAGEPQADEHALQLATAVLLVEVMRADADWHDDEREAVLAALREKFELDDGEAARLSELAHEHSKQATDLFTFTERINRHFDMPRKLRMVELMWRVALADGTISAHERHLMWRVGDLLHVPQAALHHARQRAQGGVGSEA